MRDELQRARERRADEVLEFLGAEPVPDDYEPEPEQPRLLDYRAAIERVERVCEESKTGHVSVVKIVAAIHGTGTERR